MSRKSTSRKLNDWYAHAVCVRELAGCQNHTSRTSAKTMRLRHLRLADKRGLCQKQLLSLTQLSTKCCFWCVKSVICLPNAHTQTQKALIIKSGRAVTRPAHAVCACPRLVPPSPYPLSHFYLFFPSLTFSSLPDCVCFGWACRRREERQTPAPAAGSFPLHRGAHPQVPVAGPGRCRCTTWTHESAWNT
jgi:hypothetical protein